MEQGKRLLRAVTKHVQRQVLELSAPDLISLPVTHLASSQITFECKLPGHGECGACTGTLLLAR